MKKMKALLAAAVFLLMPSFAHAQAKTFYPFGIHAGTGTGAGNVTNSAADTCRCILFSIANQCTHIDRVVVPLFTGRSVTCTGHCGELAIFKYDGSTRYFHSTIDFSATTTQNILDCGSSPLANTACSANTDTVTAMPAGDYWFCWTNQTSTPTFSLGGQTLTAARFSLHTETCTGGVMPSTLTSPNPGTWTTAAGAIPVLSFSDEQ